MLLEDTLHIGIIFQAGQLEFLTRTRVFSSVINSGKFTVKIYSYQFWKIYINVDTPPDILSLPIALPAIMNHLLYMFPASIRYNKLSNYGAPITSRTHTHPL
jgi:hypothetical protein